MRRTIPVLCSFALCMYSYNLQACTVFAATGESLVQGGGTLVAKVRDERPARQVVKTVRPDSGWAYTGLFVGKKERFNMGVNEKGLVVFRTTAGSVPKDVRRQAKRWKSPGGLSGHEYIIRHYATVDEALTSNVFSEPTNYLIADATKIAFVEVLPDGAHAAKVYEQGRFAHTNHYVLPQHQHANTRIGTSSLTRYMRINALMNEQVQPYQLEDFIGWTKDRHDGPDNSIERIGIPGKSKITTLSAMVVYLPKEGAPQIYLRWRPDPATQDMRQAQEKRLTVTDF